jgi:hypothetical protein
VIIRETPGYRTEQTRLGGVKASGLGVRRASSTVRAMTNVKLTSLPDGK